MPTDEMKLFFAGQHVAYISKPLTALSMQARLHGIACTQYGETNKSPILNNHQNKCLFNRQ